MLAQYNLGTDYKQSTTANTITFSDTYGWEYTPGPKEIDIQNYDGNVKIYVNEYAAYLQNETGDTNISSNLIKLVELKELGCIINEDYSYSDGLTCANSDYSSWLVNGQHWWTRSANANYEDDVWRVSTNGALFHNSNYNEYGVRPIITISKDTLA